MHSRLLFSSLLGLTVLSGTAQGLQTKLNGTVDNLGSGSGIGGSSNYIVVGNQSDHTVAVFDISIEGSATFLGAVSCGVDSSNVANNPRDSLIFGDYALVQPFNNKYNLAHVQLSPSVQFLGTVSTGCNQGDTFNVGELFPFVLKDTVVYSGNNDPSFGNTFGVISINNPASPVYVTEVSLPISGMLQPKILACSDTHLFVVSNSGGASLSYVFKYNLVNPLLPAFSGQSLSIASAEPTAISFTGAKGVLLVSDKTLKTFDPATMLTLDNYTFPSSQTPNGLAINGNLAYVTCYEDPVSKLTVFDTTSGVTLVDSVDMGITPFANCLQLAGTKLMVVSTSGEAEIFDISTTPPTSYGTCSTGGFNPFNLFFNGTTGYVPNQGGYTGIIVVGASSGNNISTVGGGILSETARLYNRNLNSPISALAQLAQNIASLPSNEQNDRVQKSTPVFKVLQFTLEKLDLLIQKELDGSLYGKNCKTTPFLIAGYDQLNQSSVNSYPGYNVDNYFQLLGVTHAWHHANYLAGLGVSESYLTAKSFPGKASYTTVYGTLGAGKNTKDWVYGLKGLFGYSFLDTERTIDFIDAKAHSSHGAWNLSVEGKLGYKIKATNAHVILYDTIGYIYGHENNFTEKGASPINYSVKDENLSQLRNALGFAVDAPKKSNVKFFLDAAWVYEYYFNDNSYQCSFENTGIWGRFTQQRPALNYGRVNLGLFGSHKKFDWKLAYYGLFGKNLSDNGVSVKFDYRF